MSHTTRNLRLSRPRRASVSRQRREHGSLAIDGTESDSDGAHLLSLEHFAQGSGAPRMTTAPVTKMTVRPSRAGGHRRRTSASRFTSESRGGEEAGHAQTGGRQIRGSSEDDLDDEQTFEVYRHELRAGSAESDGGGDTDWGVDPRRTSSAGSIPTRCSVYYAMLSRLIKRCALLEGGCCKCCQGRACVCFKQVAAYARVRVTAGLKMANVSQ